MKKVSIAVVSTFVLLVAAFPADAQGVNCSPTFDPLDPQLLYALPPNAPGNAPGCNFHNFAWENFLWFVSGDPMANPLSRQPTSDQLFPMTGVPACPTLTPTPPTLGDISKEEQAGSKLPLYAQNGRFLQYEVRVNPSLYDYTRSRRLFNQDCFNISNQKLPSGASRIMLPDDSAGQDISIEFKVAWLPMDECDPRRYVCITDQGEELGLVGIHIIEKIMTNQEWVWTSFEHVDNSPNCKDVSDAPSTRAWTFFPDATQCVADCSQAANNGPNCPTFADANVVVDCSDPANVCCNHYDSTSPRTNPTNVCKLVSILDNNDPVLNDGGPLVVDLNGKLQNVLAGAGSVLANYELIGTLWSAKPVKPWAPKPQPTGSISLANSVMETYSQGPFPFPDPLTRQTRTGCFNCHANTPAPHAADFSHLFARIVQTRPQCGLVPQPSSCFPVAGEPLASKNSAIPRLDEIDLLAPGAQAFER